MKKYSFAIIAVVFALFSAFAMRPQNHNFRFDGSTIDPADRVDPQEYTLVEPSCSGSENILCGIVAAKTSLDKPVITPGSTLHTALDNGGSIVEPDFGPVAVIGTQQ